jgi:hypothetical protein
VSARWPHVRGIVLATAAGGGGVNVADLARVAPEISAWNQAETLPSRPTYAKSAMISWLEMIQPRRADNSRWSPLIDAAGSGRGRRAEPLGVRGALYLTPSIVPMLAQAEEPDDGLARAEFSGACRLRRESRPRLTERPA